MRYRNARSYRLPDEIIERLEQMDESKSDIVRKALLLYFSYLEESHVTLEEINDNVKRAIKLLEERK